jgi:hypothetical protein
MVEMKSADVPLALILEDRSEPQFLLSQQTLLDVRAR